MDDDLKHDPSGMSAISRQSGNGSGDLAKKARERRTAMARGLSLAHVGLGREVPTDEEMEVTVNVYLELLPMIPTRHLNRCFQQAIRSHTSMATMIGANEVLTAFRSLSESGVFRHDENPLKSLEGPRMSPDELRAAIQALRREVWPNGIPRRRRGFNQAARNIDVQLEKVEELVEDYDYDDTEEEDGI